MGLAGAGPGIGFAPGGTATIEGEFGPEHRGQAHGAGRLGEAHHTVETVVIGEGECLEPEPHGLLDQHLRRTGPVEEAEVRMTVQFGVGDARCTAQKCGGLIGTAPARPGRGVGTVTEQWCRHQSYHPSIDHC